jgi:phage shock protein PspC (stress-responsive transcriptional regulator)
MNLATPKILAIALPLALFELLIAVYIVTWVMAPSINLDDA